MKTMSSTEAKSQLCAAVARARYLGESTVITVYGEAAAVLVPVAACEEMSGKAKKRARNKAKE